MKRNNFSAWLVSIYVLFVNVYPMSAQNWWNDQQKIKEFREHMILLQSTPPPIHNNEKCATDPNHYYEVASDAFFNEGNLSKVCYTLNGLYLGPYDIGIDRTSLKKRWIGTNADTSFTIHGIGKGNDSLVICKDEPKQKHAIRGRDFYAILNYDSEGRDIKLVTLEEIKKALLPDIKAPVVYMINKFIITRDEDLYRLDRDFIMKTETISSSEILSLRSLPPFTILRIFTWTHHNWHQAQKYEGPGLQDNKGDI